MKFIRLTTLLYELLTFSMFSIEKATHIHRFYMSEISVRITDKLHTVSLTRSLEYQNINTDYFFCMVE